MKINKPSRHYHHQLQYSTDWNDPVWYRYILTKKTGSNSFVLRTYHDDGRFISKENISLEKAQELMKYWNEYYYEQKYDSDHDHSIPNGWPHLQSPKNKEMTHSLYLAERVRTLPISAFPGLCIELNQISAKSPRTGRMVIFKTAEPIFHRNGVYCLRSHLLGPTGDSCWVEYNGKAYGSHMLHVLEFNQRLEELGVVPLTSETVRNMEHIISTNYDKGLNALCREYLNKHYKYAYAARTKLQMKHRLQKFQREKVV